MALATPITATPPSHVERAGAVRVLHHRARAFGAAIFLAALFLPFVGAGLKWDPVASSENRALAKFPGMPRNFQQIKIFSDLFMGFYRDHFGFRNTLIRGLALGRFHGGLGMDRGTNIIIGKDGFLFFPSSVQDGFLAERSLDPFSSAQLDEWQQLLERRNKFFTERGIPFIVVIPPDKQSIYTEMMPEEFSRVGPKTRLDQLIDRLRETHSPVRLVDLRPVLLEAKKYHRIYFKTDTHWNDYGAFAAYPVILDAIQSVLPGRKLVPQPLSDFIPRTRRKSGDLAKYMDLYYEYDEDWLELERRVPFPRVSSTENPYAMVVTHGPDPTAPRLFMYHDSFTNYLGQFLGPNFSTATWQWTNTLDGQEALNAKPDVVVDEFLERLLYAPLPPDSADIRDQKLP
jgi:alginate O-acetyltransferase complex protein AlgJ